MAFVNKVEHMRVGIITLGCDKNTVDNEYLAGLLENAGCVLVFPEDTDNPVLPNHNLDAAVVTTCGFMGDAKQQSIETIVALAEDKRATGFPRRLYVAGCLSQRYADELIDEIPEIDAVVGVGQFESLALLIAGEGSTQAGKSLVNPAPAVNIDHIIPRKATNPRPYAFLKIADGCNHTCTFCSIPAMKGPFRSVAPDILLSEAQSLLKRGAREINLIAQDITVYGTDRWKDYGLPRLLRELCVLKGDFWVRCLYCYPGGVTDALIDAIANEPKIVPYLDIPIQHFDPQVLRRMNRPDHGLDVDRLVRRLRAAVPDITLRTTLLVGFPGETPRAHRLMLEGIERLRFERLGAFQYSREEGTPAAKMPRQVGNATRRKRWNAVMNLQAEIAEEANHRRIGQRVRVLIEYHDPERDLWIGRSAAEAPDVDGNVLVHAPYPLDIGQFIEVEITASDVYDVAARPA